MTYATFKAPYESRQTQKSPAVGRGLVSLIEDGTDLGYDPIRDAVDALALRLQGLCYNETVEYI
jgi:hypothetical protein